MCGASGNKGEGKFWQRNSVSHGASRPWQADGGRAVMEGAKEKQLLIYDSRTTSNTQMASVALWLKPLAQGMSAQNSQ